MRRTALSLCVAAALTAFPAPPAGAGPFSDDVYRSRFLAQDRIGRAYVIEAVVDDRSSGTMLVLTIRRRCGSCRTDVYARTLKPGEFTVRREAFGAECQCFVARVDTEFGGAQLTIDWAWDPEQNGEPSGDGFEYTAVTGNNLMYLACHGSGVHTSTPNLTGGEPPSEPRGAKPFPKRMPTAFEPDRTRYPSCYVDEP